MKILVADDAPYVAQRVARLIDETSDAIEVLGPVFSGTEALRLYRQHLPEGLVVDLNMPDVSGLEVLASVRAMGQPCFIVILTSSAEESIRDHCLAAGADHFVDKRTNINELPEVIAHLVATRKSPSAL